MSGLEEGAIFMRGRAVGKSMNIWGNIMLMYGINTMMQL